MHYKDIKHLPIAVVLVALVALGTVKSHIYPVLEADSLNLGGHYQFEKIQRGDSSNINQERREEKNPERREEINPERSGERK
jgi:hypothetical protein